MLLNHLAAQAMKAQASYSSWYFVERAAIGDIRVNCTIALSSAILASSRRSPDNADASRAKVSHLPLLCHLNCRRCCWKCVGLISSS